MMCDFYDYAYAVDAQYCYPGTNILKNKLNIRNLQQLQEAEREITSLRTAEFLDKATTADYHLDMPFFKELHRFIFQDVYAWAGEFRTVDIAKGNMSCRSVFIEAQLAEIFSNLKAENDLMGLTRERLAVRLAHYLGELNAVHPFREGNGRVQRIFITLLALKNGYHAQFSKISKEDMLRASNETFHLHYEFMEQLMEKILE